MVEMRPSELRIIFFLSGIALASTIYGLAARQNRIDSLNLNLLLDNSPYQYSAKLTDVKNARADYFRMSEKDTLFDTLSGMVTPPVNINSAGFYDLVRLPGVGPVLAERIMVYRDSVGQFKKIDELQNIKGIGPVKFGSIKKAIVLQ